MDYGDEHPWHIDVGLRTMDVHEISTKNTLPETSLGFQAAQTINSRVVTHLCRVNLIFNMQQRFQQRQALGVHDTTIVPLFACIA